MRLTFACSGPFPPDSEECEPPMLPPYRPTLLHRPLLTPLAMPYYLLAFCERCLALARGTVDALGQGVDKSHGKVPWDDIIGVVKQAVVDTPTQSMRRQTRRQHDETSFQEDETFVYCYRLGSCAIVLA